MSAELEIESIGSYLHVEQLVELRQLMDFSQKVFREACLESRQAIPSPFGVARILMEWRAPFRIIKLALWGSILPYTSDSELGNALDQGEMTLIGQLGKLNNVLVDARKRESFAPLFESMDANFWPTSLLALLVAFFLDTMRIGSEHATDIERKLLAHQSRCAIEEILARRISIGLAHRELRELRLQAEDLQQYLTARHEVSTMPSYLPLVERVTSQIKSIADASEMFDFQVVADLATLDDVAVLTKRSRRLSACDYVGIRILLPDEQDCYRFLPVLSRLGNVGASFRDYLAHPMRNGYRSLHVRVTLPAIGPLKFMICTPSIHVENETGGHSVWADLDSYVSAAESQWREASTFQQHKQIYVFTISGQPYMLPDHAAVIDLAYAVSTALGDRAAKARINGGQDGVDMTHTLSDGDIVEILSGPRLGPNALWLNAAKTERARRAIESWPARSIKFVGVAADASVDHVANADVHPLLVIPAEWASHQVKLCTRCKPYPPHSIGARVRANGSVTVHRTTCTFLQNTTPVIRVDWRRASTWRGQVTLRIEAWDRIGLIGAISHEVTSAHAQVTSLTFVTETNGTSHASLSLQYVQETSVEVIVNALRQIPSVVSVTETSAHLEVDNGRLQPLGSVRGRWINPYSPQPVGTESIFFGRATELQRVYRAIDGFESGRALYIRGQQRIGKTSLLMRIEAAMSEEPSSPFLPVRMTMMDLEQLNSHPSSLVIWLAEHIERSVRDQIGTDAIGSVGPDHELLLAHPLKGLSDYLELLAQSPLQRKVLIMIDEFQMLAWHRTPDIEVFLRCLQNLLNDRSDVSMVFAGYAEARKRSQSQLFEHLVGHAFNMKLGVLDSSAAVNLIRRPVFPWTYEEGVVERILDLTHGHPYYIQLLCHDIVDRVLDQQSPTKISQKILSASIAAANNWPPGVYSHLLRAVPRGEELLHHTAHAYAQANAFVRLPLIQSSIGSTFEAEQLRQILNDLVDLEVLEQDQDQEDAYRIFLPLLHAWIRKNSRLEGRK